MTWVSGVKDVVPIKRFSSECAFDSIVGRILEQQLHLRIFVLHVLNNCFFKPQPDVFLVLLMQGQALRYIHSTLPSRKRLDLQVLALDGPEQLSDVPLLEVINQLTEFVLGVDLIQLSWIVNYF